MVKPNITKRAGVGKPFSQFKVPKRPEVTRLPSFDDADGCLPTTGKVFGKGSGKYGRPIVTDLIRLWENESKLVQESANKRDRAQGQLQAALAAQEAEWRNVLNAWIPLTKTNVPATQTLSLIDDRFTKRFI